MFCSSSFWQEHFFPGPYGFYMFLPVIDFIHKLFAAQFPGLPIWGTTLVILVKFEMWNPKGYYSCQLSSE